MAIKLNPFTGSFDIISDVNSANPGSAASPGIYFVGDPDTGIYSPGADQVAISTGGSGRLFVDASGNIGVASSSVQSLGANYSTLEIKGKSGGYGGGIILSPSDAATVPAVWYYDGACNFGSLNSTPVSFLTNGSERLRITSAGLVGVGTSSPVGKFAVGNSSNNFLVSIDSTASYAEIQAYNAPLYINRQGNNTILNTGGGSVGIGTSTPQASLDITSGTFQAVRTNLSSITDTFHQYRGTPDGVGYEHARVFSGRDTSVHTYGSYLAFYTEGKASGTTDTSLERLRIDSSGRVGIGITGPTATVHANSGSASDVYFRSSNSLATTSLGTAADGSTYVYNSSAYPISFFTNATERARIDSSGRLLVGTSTARSNVQGSLAPRLQVEGTDGSTSSFTLFRNQTSSAPILGLGASGGTTAGSVDLISGAGLGTINFYGTDGVKPVRAASIEAATDGGTGLDDMPGRLVFSTTADGASSPTERMRISSNGKTTIKGATTDSSAYSLEVTESGGIVQFTIRNDGVILTGTDTLSPYNNTTASAANLFVTSGGELQRSTSSLKYKKNIQDAPYGLQELMALRAVTYQGKSTSDGDTVYGGLIAEEVDAAGLQEFVQYADDGTPDALAYGNMVSLCIKAIQEQQEMIAELQAKVAALEAA